jgi:hypothetical protein
LPIACPIATVKIGISLKPSGGGGRSLVLHKKNKKWTPKKKIMQKFFLQNIMYLMQNKSNVVGFEKV